MLKFTLLYKRKGNAKVVRREAYAVCEEDALRCAPRTVMQKAKVREYEYELFGVLRTDGSSRYRKEIYLEEETKTILQEAEKLLKDGGEEEQKLAADIGTLLDWFY